MFILGVLYIFEVNGLVDIVWILCLIVINLDGIILENIVLLFNKVSVLVDNLLFCIVFILLNFKVCELNLLVVIIWLCIGVCFILEVILFICFIIEVLIMLIVDNFIVDWFDENMLKMFLVFLEYLIVLDKFIISVFWFNRGFVIIFWLVVFDKGVVVEDVKMYFVFVGLRELNIFMLESVEDILEEFRVIFLDYIIELFCIIFVKEELGNSLKDVFVILEL